MTSKADLGKFLAMAPAGAEDDKPGEPDPDADAELEIHLEDFKAALESGDNAVACAAFRAAVASCA